jgi:5'-deoxynucleotidase YfbR-like HD superfamily hydrolase
VAKGYVRADESKDSEDQLSKLNIAVSEFSDVIKYVEDADALELAFQAVEYSLINSYAIKFGEGLNFKTETARKIYFNLMDKREPAWWK